MARHRYSSIAPNSLPFGRRATPAGVPGHDVQFYDSDEFLVDAVANFLTEGLRVGQPHIVIATEAHRRQLTDVLASTGHDVAELIKSRDVIWLDARQTLESFMLGGMPNVDLFTTIVGSLFERVMKKRTYLVVRAYGEMVDLLWKDGNAEAAIALEDLWNMLASKYSFSLLCAYAMSNFYKEAHTANFWQICARHDHAIPTEEYLDASDADRLRQLAVLQQRARALDDEVKHRRELEEALHEVVAQRGQLEETLRRREAELEELRVNAADAMH